MIALSTDAPKSRTRSPRKPGDQSPKCAPAKVAKSKDAGKTKVSLYLDAAVSEKLAVSAIIRGGDQSDVANEILRQALSSVTFYEKRSSDSTLLVGEDRLDASN